MVALHLNLYLTIYKCLLVQRNEDFPDEISYRSKSVDVKMVCCVYTEQQMSERE